MSEADAKLARWNRFVAIGDSFTEGLGDLRTDGSLRGWADRMAETLSDRREAAGLPALEYANLAIRGKKINQILTEQLDAALELRPDLVSLAGGGNDQLRVGSRPEKLAYQMDLATRRILATGADVLLAVIGDPTGSPLIEFSATFVARLNCHIWSLAARHPGRVFVLDLWGNRALHRREVWCSDHLHMNPEGHRRAADGALVGLGLAPQDPHYAIPEPEWVTFGPDLRENLAWVGRDVAPWLARHARGRSSGDGRSPKRPAPHPIAPYDGR